MIIEDSSFKRLTNFLSERKYSSIVILADSNTVGYCVPLLVEQVPFLNSSPVIIVSSGEKNKTLHSVEKIISELVSCNADRNGLLVNVGGGMITDLGGFAASVYKRGIDFIHVPTSLMAMVDAAIGGKTGVNISDIKNIAGTFAIPESVFIYHGFLQTLPEREYKSAYAEIIKHILLSDSKMWDQLVSNQLNFFAAYNLPGLIDHSVKFKQSVVSIDLHDRGGRQILNLGHTLGHAIESSLLDSPAKLFHGEAIACGLIGELYLSTKLTGLKDRVLSEAIQIISAIYPNLSFALKKQDLFPFLYADKKNNSTSIGFSLLKSPGEPAKLCFPSAELIDESIEFIINTLIDTNQFVNDKN